MLPIIVLSVMFRDIVIASSYLDIYKTFVCIFFKIFRFETYKKPNLMSYLILHVVHVHEMNYFETTKTKQRPNNLEIEQAIPFTNRTHLSIYVALLD